MINYRISRWWLVCILGLIGIWVSIVNINPEDFWWHMKIGDIIRETGSIPNTGIFSQTRATNEFVYQSWGSELLFSWLYSLGGLSLLHILRTILILLTYTLVGWNAFTRTENGRAAAIAVLLAASVAFTNWGIRPQMFSMPIGALMLLILERTSREHWSIWSLAALPILEVLWVNVHGAFILGPLVVGAYAVGAYLDRRFDHIEAVTFPTFRALWISTGATVLAILLNPRGFGVFNYVWNLLTDPSSQLLVSEWASPLKKLDLPISQFFLLVVVVGILFVGVSYRSLRAIDLILFTGLTVLAFTGIRYMLWFGIIVTPIIADAIIRRGRLAMTRKTSETTPIAAILGISLAVIVLLIQAPWRSILPIESFQAVNTPIKRADLVTMDTGLGAAEYLAAQPTSQVIFNDESYGSYFIWRLGEQVPVFVDTRIELYPLTQWQDFKCISQAQNWSALLAQYGISTVVIKRPDQNELQRALEESAEWRSVYSDESSSIFERQTAAQNVAVEPCTVED